MGKIDPSIENMKVKKKSGTYKGDAQQEKSSTKEKETFKDGGFKASGSKAGKSYGKKPAAPVKKGGKSNSKPWEQMNQKKDNKGVSQGTKKESQKENKKVVSEFKSFLYLVPKKVSVSEMAKCLDFLPQSAIEIWTEEGVLEITIDGSAITFENMEESLDAADQKVLKGLGQVMAYACDYESTKADIVKKMAEAFLEKFGGKLGSDTEDFVPFITVDEI